MATCSCTRAGCPICDPSIANWHNITPEKLASIGTRQRCSSPSHSSLMRNRGHCLFCGDVRYPTADEREHLHRHSLADITAAGSAAMSHDAGSIGNPETFTARRTAWNALGSMHQQELRQKVVELVNEFRQQPGIRSLEEQVDRVFATVLDQ